MEEQQGLESSLHEAVQQLSDLFTNQMEAVKQLTAFYMERGQMPSVQIIMEMRSEIIELGKCLKSLKAVYYQDYADISGNTEPAGGEIESFEAESDNASGDTILLESEVFGNDAAGAEDDSQIAHDLATLKLT